LKGLVERLDTNFFLRKLNKVKESLGKRKGPNVIWLRENEDDTKLTIPDPNGKTGINTMSRALTDFEEGIAVLTGKPNSGKSTILVNMMLQSLSLNNDLVVIDFSFDDNAKKRYQQYVASQSGLTYQEITTSTDLTPNQLLAKKQAEQRLEELIKTRRLYLFESSEQFEDGFWAIRKPERMMMIGKMVRDEHPGKKIAVFVDAWNDVDTSDAKGSNDLERSRNVLRDLQDWSTDQKLMVFLSAHLRKTNDGKPGMDDIKGIGELSYNAVWIGLVRNELRENVLTEPLVYEEGEFLYPIATVETVKTKSSCWDLPIFYVLKAMMCGLKPLTRQESIGIFSQYKEKRR